MTRAPASLRRMIPLSAVIVTVLGSATVAQTTGVVAYDLSGLYEQVAPYVGSVLVDGRLKGTCFLTMDGLVVTNAHVVLGGEESLRVGLGDLVTPCQLITANAGADVAVLRPEALVTGGLELATAMPAPGTPVWTVGYDAGTLAGLAPGIVAGPPVYQTTDDPPLHGAYRLCIRTKVQLGPGSSGSPLLDSAGRVVGLHWGVKSGAGLAMSVPASAIETTLAYARAGLADAAPLPLPPQPYPYLGLMVRETWESRPTDRANQVVEALRSAYGGEPPAGVLVSNVLTESPAARGGLEAWDLIESLGGRPTRSAYEYAAAVTELAVNDLVDVALVRVVDGKPRSLSRTLAAGDANRDVCRRMGSIHAEVALPQGGAFDTCSLTDGAGEVVLRISIGNAASADVSGFRLSLSVPESVMVVPGTAEVIVPLLGTRRPIDELALTSPDGVPLGPVAGAAGYDPKAGPAEREHVTLRLRLTAAPVPGESYVSRAFDCHLWYGGAECDREMVVIVRRG